MARRSGTFMDRIIEGLVFVLVALYFLGGPLWMAAGAFALVVLRLYRIWAEISRKG